MPAKIKQFTKQTINSMLLTLLQYRQGDKRSIFLFTIRKGESTHLGGLVVGESSMRYGDLYNLTDFDIHKRQIRKAYLSRVPYSLFVTLSDSEADQGYQFTRQLLNGRLPELQSYRPSKIPTIIKILNASTLVDWFEEYFDVFKIYLARRPIPQSLLVWKLTTLKYYLKRFKLRSETSKSCPNNYLI